MFVLNENMNRLVNVKRYYFDMRGLMNPDIYQIIAIYHKNDHEELVI